MSAWSKKLDRVQQEWAVQQLQESGRLASTKANATPEMRRRIENAERRIRRNETK